MVYVVGIGAVLALLLAINACRAVARHDRTARLIRKTPVTTIADLVQVATAHAEPSTRTPNTAVEGRVVARKLTRLTAPITGSSCVAYEVRVFHDDGDEDEVDRTECLIHSRAPTQCVSLNW